MYIKKKYKNSIKFFREIVIQYKPILKCNCERQICNGRYIQTRPNQTECLYAIWEKEKIAEYENYIPLGKRPNKIIEIDFNENYQGIPAEHREDPETLQNRE